MPDIHTLLAANAHWAETVDPCFLQDLSVPEHRPHTMWIGCSDARVPAPASVVEGAEPGDIFVHRNIANQFHLKDDNVLSVLRYAVDTLKVQDVVVVGHSHCGGAEACFNAAKKIGPNPEPPIATVGDDPNIDINRWLQPLTLHTHERLENLPNLQAVVEENVKLQVANLSKSEVIRKALSTGTVRIHGLVYDIVTGKLTDLHVSQGV